MREIVAGLEERWISRRSMVGLVSIKAIYAAEKGFRYVWLIDEGYVSVANDERNGRVSWLGGDSMSARLASGAMVALSGARLAVYEIGQRAIACK